MEDERSDGGSSWSPVGQLAADRPSFHEASTDDAAPADRLAATEDAAPPRAPVDDGGIRAEDPPAAPFDLAAFSSAEVVSADPATEARTPAHPPQAEAALPLSLIHI